MPHIEQAFLEQYHMALQQTLTAYLSADHDNIDKLRITITLQFMIEYNQRLLNTLRLIKFLPKASQATANLLCLFTEEEYEAAQDISDNMLVYYEKIADQMVDKINPHFKKISLYMMLTLLSAVSIRCFSYALDTEKFDAGVAIAGIWFFVLLGFRTSVDYSVAQFTSFSQDETFTLPNGPHQEPINILEIKHWFETSQVFFSKSLADTVKDTMTENALQYVP